MNLLGSFIIRITMFGEIHKKQRGERFHYLVFHFTCKAVVVIYLQKNTVVFNDVLKSYSLAISHDF